MSEEERVYDVEGFEAITEALRELLNTFPALKSGDIAFASMDANSGLSMLPTSGAVVKSEHVSIIGKVRRVCQYPFTLTYRGLGLSSDRKAAVKEWMDSLGRWLEGEPVLVNGSYCQLEAYPALTGGRKILSIDRSTPTYLESVNQNQSEDWTIYMVLKYKYEFQRNQKLM